MSERLFVDTGYIIALTNENDHYHQQALALFEKYEGYRLVITDAVLYCWKSVTPYPDLLDHKPVWLFIIFRLLKKWR